MSYGVLVWYWYVTELHAYDLVIKRGVICARPCKYICKLLNIDYEVSSEHPLFESLFWHAHSVLCSPATVTLSQFLKRAVFLRALGSLPFPIKSFLYSLLDYYLLLPFKFSSCHFVKEATVSSSTESLSWVLPSQDSLACSYKVHITVTFKIINGCFAPIS